MHIYNQHFYIFRFKKRDIPYYRFKEQKQIFTFKSFLNKSEAISTLAKIRTECDSLSSKCIVVTNISKAIKIDEFELLQNNNIQQMKEYLHEKYLKDNIYK